MVAELADALASGASPGNRVEVQVLSTAFFADPKPAGDCLDLPLRTVHRMVAGQNATCPFFRAVFGEASFRSENACPRQGTTASAGETTTYDPALGRKSFHFPQRCPGGKSRDSPTAGLNLLHAPFSLKCVSSHYPVVSRL